MPEPTRAPTRAPTATPAPAPVRAAASGPMARIGRPGTAKPAAASPSNRAPSPPPVAAPMPAPSAALLPSSVVMAVLGKWCFRASSDISRLTSSLPYPRAVRHPYPRSAASRLRNMQVIICRGLSFAIARLLQAPFKCRRIGMCRLLRRRDLLHAEADRDGVAHLHVVKRGRRKVELHPPLGCLHVHPALLRVHLGHFPVHGVHSVLRRHLRRGGAHEGSEGQKRCQCQSLHGLSSPSRESSRGPTAAPAGCHPAGPGRRPAARAAARPAAGRPARAAAHPAAGRPARAAAAGPAAGRPAVRAAAHPAAD